MAVKLYVGNLPYTTTDDDLRQAFEQFGPIASASVIVERDPSRENGQGRSKGFGFVEFEQDENAKAAIEAMNGKEFGGRNLVVNEARPREDRPRRDFGGQGGRGQGGSFRQRSW